MRSDSLRVLKRIARVLAEGFVGNSQVRLLALRAVSSPLRTAKIAAKWRNDSRSLPLRVRSHLFDYFESHYCLARTTGEFPDLVAPASYNDKVQWLKLFDQDPATVTMVDKLAVRDYVADCVGEQYLIPIRAHASRATDLAPSDLHPPFAIKATHDSGSTSLVFTDAENVVEKAVRKAERARRRRWGVWYAEWPYRYVCPRLVVEELIGEDNQPPTDYKFHCVNGEVIWVQLFWSRADNLQETSVFPDGSASSIGLNAGAHMDAPVSLPSTWNEMLNVASRLSKGKKYVRVDLYSVQERVYFGELTFFPKGGYHSGPGRVELGSLLPIDTEQPRDAIVGTWPIPRLR
jgi:hypothetical protein